MNRHRFPPMQASESDLSAAGAVCSIADAVRLLAPLLADPERERLAAIALDRAKRAIGCEVLTIGSDAHCIVEPRQVLRWALTRERAAAAVIIAHNHPSGDPTPSEMDEQVTRRMADACTVVGVQLLDHLVICASDRWTSFAERGLITPAGAFHGVAT